MDHPVISQICFQSTSPLFAFSPNHFLQNFDQISMRANKIFLFFGHTWLPRWHNKNRICNPVVSSSRMRSFVLVADLSLNESKTFHSISCFSHLRLNLQKIKFIYHFLCLVSGERLQRICRLSAAVLGCKRLRMNLHIKLWFYILWFSMSSYFWELH